MQNIKEITGNNMSSDIVELFEGLNLNQQEIELTKLRMNEENKLKDIIILDQEKRIIQMIKNGKFSPKDLIKTD